MPSEGLQAALDDAARVVKVQRTTAERVDACMDQLISLVCAAREQLASGASPGAVGELKKQVQKLGIEKDMNSQTKELHAAVGKLNKVRAARRAPVPAAMLCAIAPRQALHDLQPRPRRPPGEGHGARPHADARRARPLAVPGQGV
jgi:hypothetical protein